MPREDQGVGFGVSGGLPRPAVEEHGRQMGLLGSVVLEGGPKTTGNGGIGEIAHRETDPDGVGE